jgi:diaminopimelate decarboxylase
MSDSAWLKRPKKGQEERTRERFNDYFDMFENAGVPINWLKVVGGAMINWIRENYSELYPDIVAEFSSVQGEATHYATC